MKPSTHYFQVGVFEGWVPFCVLNPGTTWLHHFMSSCVVRDHMIWSSFQYDVFMCLIQFSFLFFEIHTGRIPFAFLEEIHLRFVKTFGRAVLSAQPYAMNDEFSRILSQQMEYFSSDPNADRINRLKGEMSQVIITSDNCLASSGYVC